MAKKAEDKVTELTKGKPRKEEEKFFLAFSGTQLNVILILILASTFLVQGMGNLLAYIQTPQYIVFWFMLVISAIVLLAGSAIIMTLGSVISPLRGKRITIIVSFLCFIFGSGIFVASLIFLLSILM
ncbi:MAG: hypothetical protein ABIF92_00270 [archaeon]